MATLQIAAFDDRRTGWDEMPVFNSSNQLTDAATKFARFFENLAIPRHLEETKTSPVRDSSIPQGSAVEVLHGGRDDVIEWSEYGTDVRGSELAGIGDAFEQVFAARGSDRDRLAERLITVASADSVTRAAFEQFRNRGNAERLVLAAALLERYGHGAVRPLRGMGRASVPESEYFVDVLANLAENPSLFESMTELLRIWSEHPVRDVRRRLVDISDGLPQPLRNWLLNLLVADRDEEVSESARESLQSHA